MNQSLKQLTLSREARREAALARLADSRSLCDQAYAACQQAAAEVEAAKQSRSEILARCALGAGQGWRESLLPACEALLQLRQQAFAAQQSTLRTAIERLAAQRRRLVSCERDLLRLAEWQAMLTAQADIEGARQENLADEELAPARSTRARAA